MNVGQRITTHAQIIEENLVSLKHEVEKHGFGVPDLNSDPNPPP